MKHPNGRLVTRDHEGRFRQARAEDIGVGGVCDTCGHLMLRYYDGDNSIVPRDPSKYRYRCFTCEPEREREEVKA